MKIVTTVIYFTFNLSPSEILEQMIRQNVKNASKLLHLKFVSWNFEKVRFNWKFHDLFKSYGKFMGVGSGMETSGWIA